MCWRTAAMAGGHARRDGATMQRRAAAEKQQQKLKAQRKGRGPAAAGERAGPSGGDRPGKATLGGTGGPSGELQFCKNSNDHARTVLQTRHRHQPTPPEAPRSSSPPSPLHHQSGTSPHPPRPAAPVPLLDARPPDLRPPPAIVAIPVSKWLRCVLCLRRGPQPRPRPQPSPSSLTQPSKLPPSRAPTPATTCPTVVVRPQVPCPAPSRCSPTKAVWCRREAPACCASQMCEVGSPAPVPVPLSTCLANQPLPRQPPVTQPARRRCAGQLHHTHW